MTTINFSHHFRSSLKRLARKQPEVMAAVIEKILLFNHNTNHPSLKLHKLSGTLKDHWSFSIEYDLRIIFRYTNDSNILFIDIGNHNEVY
ncbi:MAG TPA: type II toxin-antitoxin system mRNA interferase toxin, RelE/StbE family, partial [Segetibacter sp.]|nr:type II toxin-antitoxin system mRNA interferase toxin, RelE/StbE family [Segetibacter sp.]